MEVFLKNMLGDDVPLASVLKIGNLTFEDIQAELNRKGTTRISLDALAYVKQQTELLYRVIAFLMLLLQKEEMLYNEERAGAFLEAVGVTGLELRQGLEKGRLVWSFKLISRKEGKEKGGQSLESIT